jgi:hypothetical protein
MARTKLPESGPLSRGDSISEDASEWIELFVKHIENSLLDTSRTLPPEASDLDYAVAAIEVMFETLLESGMQSELVTEAVGQVLVGERPGSIEWNPELNQRRFELIDKEIQETLTPAERVELARLTIIVREQLDTEANLPMEGAKALHRKLIELAAKGKPS